MNETISLSQANRQIILGGLLGDSYFNKERNFIRFNHSDKQKEYLLWKMSFFNQEDVRGLYTRKHKEGYLGYYFEFINKSHNYDDFFAFIKKNLYTNEGRKKISLKYLKEIDALGLAIWWMDDGCLSIHKGNRYGKLCTHCFNYEEHILLQKYFKNRWDIDVDIKIEKGYYFLRFNVKGLKKLINIIYKYVCNIPSMIYKIDLNYKNSKCIKEFNEVYTYIKNCLNIKEL